MPEPNACPECRRPLLWSSDALRCCYRHCPAFGRSVEDEQPTKKATPEPKDSEQ